MTAADIKLEAQMGHGDPVLVNVLMMEREYREMGRPWHERADILLEAADRLIEHAQRKEPK